MGIDALEYEETGFGGVGLFLSLLPVPAVEPVGDGYDLFILLKSSRVIRPSGGGVQLLDPRLGEFEAEIDGL